jgi:hypothetical protein
MGLEYPFAEIHLDGENCTAALPALRLLRYDTPIKTFTWRAGSNPRTLVTEVKQLQRLIARVSTIEYFELDFTNSWAANEFRYSHENGYWAWIRLFTNLLHVVAQRCHFVVITNHYQVLVPWVSFIGGVPYNLDSSLLEQMRVEWRQELKPQFRRLHPSSSKISLLHPDNATTQTAFPQPFPPEKTTTVYATRRLIINDPGLFQRSLFGEWVLEWVNNMPLTHLVIHQGRMRLPLLRQLRLPHLTSLTISHGYGLRTSDLVQVLQNNSSLASVEFLDTKLDVSSAIVMVKKRKHFKPTTHIGLTVQRMKGTAGFLRGMLDLELSFLHLNTIVVQVRGEGSGEHAQMQRLYRSLAWGGRANLTRLVFEFPAPCEKRGPVRLENWLMAATEQLEDDCEHGGMEEVMAKLVHIRAVELSLPGATGRHWRSMWSAADPSAAGSSADCTRAGDLAQLLARWASMFPALSEINLSRVFAGDTNTTQNIVQCLLSSSPRLSVGVDGVIWRSGSGRT